MRDPVAWWGHLSVISRYESPFPEYAEWHVRQLAGAIKKMTKMHPSVLSMIPAHGYHVRATRNIEKLSDGRYRHLLAVGICEDFDDSSGGCDLVIVAKANNTLRKGSIVKTPKAFGSRANAYLSLFEELIARIPRGWEQYRERQQGKALTDPKQIKKFR